MLASLMLLTGCSRPTGSGAIDTGVPTPAGACLIFDPIGWSGRDTAETIRAVKAHNAAYKAVCPQPPGS
jgi:hypothetical protein